MVDTLEYASGVSSRFTLDDYGRLQTISTSGVAGSADLDLEYGYDDRGYVTSIDDDGVTHTVTVDDIGRLTEISYGDGGDITYTWDDFGNLTDRGGTEATSLGIDFSGRSFTDNHESSATYDTMAGRRCRARHRVPRRRGLPAGGGGSGMYALCTPSTRQGPVATCWPPASRKWAMSDQSASKPWRVKREPLGSQS